MTATHVARRSRARAHVGSSGWFWIAVTILLGGNPACGPSEPPEVLALASHSQELTSANGLSANGLSANGLSANGLSANGLSASAFSAWFTQDPGLADMVMRYLVRCAVREGETRSYTVPETGQRYTWSGLLGLTPDWASGSPASEAEQQVITACMLAHVNRYGWSVPISILGRDAEGAVIPFTLDELIGYPIREACFFGNLFSGEGLFFGVDRVIGTDASYLTRACAGMRGSSSNPAIRCEPLQFIGSCSQHCTPDLLGGLFYSRCSHEGVAYRALTTRMRQSDYEQFFSKAP